MSIRGTMLYWPNEYSNLFEYSFIYFTAHKYIIFVRRQIYKGSDLLFVFVIVSVIVSAL